MENKMQIEDRELKEIAVGILSEIDRICNLHNLKYALMYGTLLGAVRHKGFIPWDDDIDIVMPIKDYKKLIEVFNKECGKNYFLQSAQTDKNYWFAYAKVRRTDTLFAEKNCRKVKGCQGIFVDIFPIFYTDNTDPVYVTSLLEKYQRCVATACIKQKLSVNFGKKAWLTAKFMPRSATKWLEKAVEDFSENETDFLIIPGMDASFKALNKYFFKKEDIFPAEKTIFEDKEFYAVKEKDKVLTQLYGDYMKLPPEDKRVTNHSTDEIRYLTEEEKNNINRQIKARNLR